MTTATGIIKHEKKIYMRVDAERLKNDMKKVDILLEKMLSSKDPDAQFDARDDARFYLEPWERMASQEVRRQVTGNLLIKKYGRRKA